MVLDCLGQFFSSPVDVMWKRGKLSFVLFTLQTLILVTFVLKGEYGKEADASQPLHHYVAALGGQDPKNNSIENEWDPVIYALVVVLLVIPLSLTTGPHFSLTSVGFCLMLVSLSFQVSLLMQLFYDEKIIIDVLSVKRSARVVIAVIVSFASLSGKLSPLQIVAFGVIEACLHSIIFQIISHQFQVESSQFGMETFLFGSLFGLSVSLTSRIGKSFSTKMESSPTHQMLSLLSTTFSVFLWPSLFASIFIGDKKHRVVINAFLSIMSSIVVSFASSSLIDGGNKLSVKHIQVGMTSGAVVISCLPAFMLYPGGAVILGMVSSSGSVFWAHKVMVSRFPVFHLQDI